MLPRSNNILATACVAALLTACVATLPMACAGADEGGATKTASPPDGCTVTLAEGLPAEALRATHARARALGAIVGERRARSYIEARTEDGYRLRGLISTSLMGLSLLLSGSLLGTLLLSLLRGRPPLSYAERLADAIEGELAALRALLAGEADARTLLAPLAPPLSAAEHEAERLADLAAAIEREPKADAPALARRAELYALLEALLDHLERLHLRAISWRDRLGDPEARPLDDAVREAAAELAARVEISQ